MSDVEDETSKPADPRGTLGTVYLHISDSGITFQVDDDYYYGPTIRINSSVFGNNNVEQIIRTDKKSLVSLAELFIKAAGHDFRKEPYCCPAKVIDYNTGYGTEASASQGEQTDPGNPGDPA